MKELLDAAAEEFGHPDALSFSSSNHIHNGTVAHLLYARSVEREPPSPEQELGSLVHCMFLEPDEVPKRYLFVEKFARRSNAAKEKWAELQADGRKVMWNELADQAYAMTSQLLNHPIAGSWAELNGLITEQKIGWKDPMTQCRHKGIVDMVLPPENKLIADLKTCSSATLSHIQKEIGNRGYHRQLAMYLDGINTICDEPVIHNAAIVCVESSGSHQVAVYQLDPSAIDTGRLGYREDARKWMAYLEDPRGWTGYPVALQTVGAPRWAQ